MPEKDYKTLSVAFMAALFAVHQNFFRKATITMPVNHFTVLMILHDEGPMTIWDMGKLLVMSKQQMTPILDKLAKYDCIIREPLPADRRFTQVSLTRKGNNIIEDFNEQLRLRIEKGLQTLGDEDFDRLADSVGAFKLSIDKMAINKAKAKTK